jgi:hypothetical protein
VTPAPETGPKLDAVLAGIWDSLAGAVRDLQHPFRTPVVATQSAEEYPLRTVVLRGADAVRRELSFHADIRSPKVRHIRRQPLVWWLFLDPGGRVQLRAEAEAVVHHQDELARSAWSNTPLSSRLNYCTPLDPGHTLQEPQEAWPEWSRGRDLTRQESEAGWQNFAIVLTTLRRLDWLRLDLAGHQRAGFAWKDGDWQGRWLVP